MTHNAQERSHVLDVARTLVSRQVLSLSLHGNISLRLPDTGRMLMTGSSLAKLTGDDLAVVDFGGTVVEGDVAPTEHEVIHMHTVVYAERPAVGCVVHTHSPFATAFAVAGRPLPVVAESLARWGFTRPIPLAKWAPRGSDDAIANIRAVLRDAEGAGALLLENHGILSWGADASEAMRRTIAIEENAQLAIRAQSLGGAREMSPEMALLAAARRGSYSRPSDRAST